MKYVHASFFSGICGFDLAAEEMGWENRFHCEINPFGRAVAKYYWPNSTCHEDIKTTSFLQYRGQIDIVSGGFPCQPYSSAGKRLGKEDDRHLWPSMLRGIREIQPPYVVGENVRGLLNWNGGVVFDEVQTDLEKEGYEVLPFLLPAAGIGAPHERYRIWFIAYSAENRRRRERAKAEAEAREEGLLQEGEQPGRLKGLRSRRDAADSDSFGERNIPGHETRIRRKTEEQSRPSDISGDEYAADSSIKDDRRSVGEQEERQEPQLGGGSISDNAIYSKRESYGGRNTGESRGNGLGVDGNQLDTPRRIESSNDTEPPSPNATHPSHEQLQGSIIDGSTGSERPTEGQGGQFSESIRTKWENFPTQPPLRGRNDGIPARLDPEAVLDLLEGRVPREPFISERKWNEESIKGYGNAIVPGLALQIFNAVEKTEILMNNNSPSE